MTPTDDRRLTDGQVAGPLGAVALATAAALALFVAGAIGIPSGRAECGEPPRRTD